MTETAAQGEPDPFELLRSLSDWRVAKTRASAISHAQLSSSVSLSDAVLNAYCDVWRAVTPFVGTLGYQFSIAVMMLRIHRLFLNALDLLVERQGIEAMALIRPGIELTADADKIGVTPALAKVWLERRKSTEAQRAYEVAFGGGKPKKGVKQALRFPHDRPLMKLLHKDWIFASDWGSHSNPHQFLDVMKIEQDRKSGSVCYFIENPRFAENLLLRFVIIAARVLKVLSVPLQSISNENLSQRLDSIKGSVEGHLVQSGHVNIRVPWIWDPKEFGSSKPGSVP